MWLTGDHLEVLVSRGSPAPLQGLILPASQIGVARTVLDSGRPLAVANTAEDARWQQVPGEERVLGWLGVPLLLEDRPLGMLEWTTRQQTEWAAVDISLAIELARCAAPILHRTQLLDDARRQLRRRTESYPAPLATSGDLPDELQPVVREALDFTDAQHAFVFLLAEGKRLHCVAASGKQRDRLAKVFLRGDGTLGGWSLPMARSPEWLGMGPSDREIMAALGIENTLILPLRVAGKPMGMLGVAEPRYSRVFAQDAIRLMTQLASQASLAVERFHAANRGTAGVDYEIIVRSSPLGVGVLTVTGIVQVCSPALANLLSGSDRSLVGANVTDWLVPSDGRRLLLALEEVSISGQGRQVDARVHTNLGGHRYIRISLSLAQTSADGGGNLVTIMEDVTPLKILERERVGHLSELREKHAQLQELDQLKSRFVSNVSHELRTPLAVIKLYATLARKGRPEKQMHYLQTIEHETHRLEIMVENILDLTRMDRRGLRISPEWLSVEEIVAQVVQVHEETAQKRGIEVQNRSQGDLPKLWADKNHLIQMLTNLLDNALKYTTQGGQIWVTAQETETDSQRILEISVGDTGAGIAEDEQEKIFDRFYRGKNNNPGTTGTGLGLAIVQELMIQHGGKVSLKSREGEGSVFALQFPLSDEKSPPGDHARA
jgi:signal transduction histidine kinase